MPRSKIAASVFLVSVFTIVHWSALAEQRHRCAGDALQRAPALLKLHLPDSGHPFGFGDQVEQITPIANPAAPRQTFDVLQGWGFVYKAKYRLRFLYAQGEGVAS